MTKKKKFVSKDNLGRRRNRPMNLPLSEHGRKSQNSHNALFSRFRYIKEEFSHMMTPELITKLDLGLSHCRDLEFIIRDLIDYGYDKEFGTRKSEGA